MIKKTITTLLLLVLVGIQFIPVDRSNPLAVQEIKWDSAETKALAKRACYDCHSNETVWPWYSYVAPISWRVAEHVEHGREHLNFSEWNRPNEDFDEIEEVLESGEMPLWDYLLMHSEAKLTSAEVQTLVSGLKATYTADPNIPRPRRSAPPPQQP